MAHGGRRLGLGRRAVLVALGTVLIVGGIATGRLLVHELTRAAPIAACPLDPAGLPTCPITYAQVTAHPESHLFYSGATVFRPFGGGEFQSLSDGKESAFAGAVLTSSDSPEQVRKWYADYMAAHGWTAYEVPLLSTEKVADAYRRGREHFLVGVDSAPALGRVLGQPVPTNETVFEVTYLIFPYQRPSPSPKG